MIKDVFDPVAVIVDCTYLNIGEGLIDSPYFHERAVIAPTNEIVEEVNDFVLSFCP